MKLKQIVDAKAPLTRMIDKELPLKTAHALWKIITKANESLGFFETKRRSILQTYGEENAGRYVPKEGMENDMHAKILELLDMEIEWDAEPVGISVEENIRLTTADITALEPFVRFKEE